MRIGLIALIGGLAFCTVCWFSITRGVADIETVISTAAAAALSDERFSGVDVNANGRTITLSGDVPTVAARVDAPQTVRSLPGVTRVISMLDLAVAERPRRRRAAPYHLFVSFSNAGAEMTGLAPSETARDALIAIADARYGAGQVTEALTVESNARAEWRDATAAMVGALAELSEVRAELTDTEVVVTGQARTREESERVASEVRATIPYGVALRFNVEVNGE